MAIAVSPHHYFALFLFIIYVGASIVTSNATYCQDLRDSKPYPVDFNCTLNVENLEEKTYGDFITELHTKLAKGGSMSRDVPILPNYGNFPHLFDILLTTKDYRTIVCVRRDNLYVRGFLIQESNQWMEFKEDEEAHIGRKMIPGSKEIPFGHSYGELERAAGTKVTSIEYTKEGLKNAVASLYKAESNAREQAKALIFMAQMISEAARFVYISTFFGSHLSKNQYLPQWMHEDLEKNWGTFSTVVQCSDQYAEYEYKEVTINGEVYKTVNDLRKIFGVMLKVTNLTEKTCGIKRIAHEEEGEGAVELSVDIQ